MGTHHFFIANPQNDHKTLMISMPASQLRGCVFEPWLRVSFVEFVFHSHASSNISKTSMQTLYSFEGVNVSANDGLLIWCHAVEWQPIQMIRFLADWCHFKPQEMNFTYVSMRFFFCACSSGAPIDRPPISVENYGSRLWLYIFWSVCLK